MNCEGRMITREFNRNTYWHTWYAWIECTYTILGRASSSKEIILSITDGWCTYRYSGRKEEKKRWSSAPSMGVWTKFGVKDIKMALWNEFHIDYGTKSFYRCRYSIRSILFWRGVCILVCFMEVHTITSAFWKWDWFVGGKEHGRSHGVYIYADRKLIVRLCPS